MLAGERLPHEIRQNFAGRALLALSPFPHGEQNVVVDIQSGAQAQGYSPSGDTVVVGSVDREVLMRSRAHRPQ